MRYVQRLAKAISAFGRTHQYGLRDKSKTLYTP